MKKLARILVMGTVLALGSVPVGHAYEFSQHESAVLRETARQVEEAEKREERSLYGYPTSHQVPASQYYSTHDEPWWAQLLVIIGVTAFVVKLGKVHAAKEKNARPAE